MARDLVAHGVAPTFGMTKTTAAYHEIRRRILTGVIVPGAAVDQESLATDLGLSTTPVREALRRLEAEDLITLAAHREARVSPLSRAELTELYGVRLSLDPLAAVLACDRFEPEGIEQLRNLLHRPPSDDLERRRGLNRAWHKAIYTRCGNTTLIHILDQLWDRSDRYRLLLSQKAAARLATPHQDHVDIVDALEARDKRLLERLMREHLESLLSALLPLLDDE